MARAGLLVAILMGACLPAVSAPSASGRLYIHGAVESSYYVQAAGSGYSSVGQGVAEGESLRVYVRPGTVALRVAKANSASARYNVIVRGGAEELRLEGLAYGASVNIAVPDSPSGAPLVLSVLPN